jgi:hypothetical protein
MSVQQFLNSSGGEWGYFFVRFWVYVSFFSFRRGFFVLLPSTGVIFSFFLSAATPGHPLLLRNSPCPKGGPQRLLRKPWTGDFLLRSALVFMCRYLACCSIIQARTFKCKVRAGDGTPTNVNNFRDEPPTRFGALIDFLFWHASARGVSLS